MKAYGTAEAQLHSFLTSVIDEGKWHRYKGQAAFLNCWTLEDGTDRLSRNVGQKPPLYVV